MSKEKQIEEMAKHCPCYFGEKCCIDGELPEKCDMLCQFGTYAEILYNAGYRKQEWISVDERLPNREGKYLVCTTNGNIGVGNFIDYYGKGTCLCFDCWAVTHWMPLPEPPKMKGGAE